MLVFGGSQRLGLALVVAVIVADQLSKHWIYQALVVEGPRSILVTPFFNLVTVWNYGVSFGMFNSGSSAASWIFILLASAISAALAIWLVRTDRSLVAMALGLILGGAVGNVIDRVRYGAVFDFLDFHAAGWHWPAFNVADAAICVGVAVLFIDSLFGEGREGKKAP
jgi:signal peptidase II